ncbi:hypothetical protein Poli38472_008959 [Pythium oligandrum]|uniref:Uncharacterized protein n=1 Tax=Pythium oligandrum TaxID=41045 RepID=A0A8K1FBN2_PYTOL|nr:hypothetical protein Poli38472_008959 [Pythium oligandrum]|eukprot:TMW56311.1 hypothetical protein Poli38472_008959 [Pythium oligandrum]
MYPPPPTDPHQQQQQQTASHMPRASPFASSGPVAMVNQIRPGGPGQFPGVAVRTNPTQLSTPLVPTRRSSSATPPNSDRGSSNREQVVGSMSLRSPAVSAPEHRNLVSPSIPEPKQRTSSDNFAAPPSGRVYADARSADEMLDEFLHVGAEDQYLLDGTLPQETFEAPLPAKKLTLADIPDTVNSLEELYKQKRWKTLTKKSLSMLQNPSNDPKRTVEIKSWWLAGLIKEGHYDNATRVLDQIGNLDDPHWSSGGGNDGDAFVTMRLRLLEAVLCKYKGNLNEHEKKLFQLVSKIKTAIAQKMEGELLGVVTDTAWKWLRIAQLTLVNHLLFQNKFSLALRVCSAIDTERLDGVERVVMLSRLGRIHLQMGDLAQAESFFALARSQAEDASSRGLVDCCGPDGALSPKLQGRLLLNDGLLFFAQNKLQEALSAFDSILHLEATASSSSLRQPAVDTEEQLFLDEDLIGVAVNNYAICALYCCDVRGAVAALERMIRSNPSRFLNAVVVFNLSSLYDLIYDNTTSTNRKEMMKKVAEMYDLEHIDPSAFRI